MQAQETPPVSPIPFPTPEILATVPSYPPVAQGLPPSHPREVLSTQVGLLLQIRAEVGSIELFNEKYWPLVENMVRFVHLLPASQRHHHTGAGGLIRHSLECGLYSIRQAKARIYASDEYPEKRRDLQKRFRYACFAGGLLHDVGKAIADMKVTDGKSIEWQPYEESIYGWAMRNSIARYHVVYIPDRFKKHQDLTISLFDSIVPDPCRQWLLDAGEELYYLTRRALLEPKNQPHNQVAVIVDASDQASVDKDLRDGGGQPLLFTGVVQRHILGAIQALIQERRKGWIPNQHGSVLWLKGKSAFIVWPKGSEAIAEYLAEHRIDGFSRNPSSIAGLMIDTALAVPPDYPDGKRRRYWHIRPALLAEGNPSVELTALCIEDAAMLFDTIPPAGVDIEILADPDLRKSDGSPSAAGPLPDIAASAQKAANSTTTTVASAEGAQPPIPSAPPPPAVPVKRQVKAPPQRGEPEAPAADTAPKEAPPISLEPSSTDAIEESRRWILGFKALGHVLMLVAEDLRDDINDRRRHVIFRENRVILSWPEALADVGFQPMDLLKQLQENGWIEPDLETHRRALRKDTEFTQAVVLTGTVTDHFLTILHPKVRAIIAGPRPAPSAKTQLPGTPEAPRRAEPAAGDPKDATAPRSYEPPPTAEEPMSVWEEFGNSIHEFDAREGAVRQRPDANELEAYLSNDNSTQPQSEAPPQIDQEYPQLSPDPHCPQLATLPRSTERKTPSRNEASEPSVITSPMANLEFGPRPATTEAPVAAEILNGAVAELIKLASQPDRTQIEGDYTFIELAAVQFALRSSLKIGTRSVIEELTSAIGQVAKRSGRDYLRIETAALK